MLFDENLAARLSRDLAATFPGSAHVSQVGLQGAGDLAIWEYARANELMLVTKDEDFHVLSVLRGHPPKVIWLRLGNCSTTEIVRLLENRREAIQAFAEHPEATFLALA